MAKVVDGKLVITKTVEEQMDGNALSRKRLQLAQQKSILLRKISQYQAKVERIDAELDDIRSLIATAEDGGVKVPKVPEEPTDEGEPAPIQTDLEKDLDPVVKAELDKTVSEPTK